MNVKQLVDFLIAHNVEIIQWLVAAILITFVGYLTASLFRKSENTSSSSGESTEDIRKALKEVLEATKNNAPAPVVMAGGPAVASGGDTAAAQAAAAQAAAEAAKLQQQVEALRKELAEKKDSGGAPDPAKDEKIAELESKLSEYEILEDDIADLSLYKEENEKLKQQLASLGSGGAVATPTPPAPVAMPEPVVEEKISQDNLVDDFAAAIEATPKAEPEVEEMAPAATPEPQEDFVAEFETVVKSTQVEAPSAPAASTLPNPREELASQSADDLMAEFERSMSPEGDSSSADVASMDLNTDKMLEEMADLANVPTDENAASALEEGIDTEKMAAEASKLKE